MTFKCMDRWVDPLMGRSRDFAGPFSCGRPVAHKGVHAWDGNGASALWTRQGVLLMALQRLAAEPEGAEQLASKEGQV